MFPYPTTNAIAMLQYVIQYNTLSILLLMHLTCFSTTITLLQYLSTFCRCSQTNRPHMNQSSIMAPIIIPDNLNIATLFPLAAIRPSLPADPFRLVLIEENLFDYLSISTAHITVSKRHVQDGTVRTLSSITSCALALS